MMPTPYPLPLYELIRRRRIAASKKAKAAHRGANAASRRGKGEGARPEA